MLLSAYPVQRAPAVCGVWGNMSVASFTLACAMREDHDSTCCSLHFQKKKSWIRILWIWVLLNTLSHLFFLNSDQTYMLLDIHYCISYLFNKPLGSWTIGNYQSNFQPHLTAVLEFAIVCFTKSSIYYLSKNITTTSIYFEILFTHSWFAFN